METGLKVRSVGVCSRCYYCPVCSHVGHVIPACFRRSMGVDVRLELFCPKDFHHYEGVDVCLSFCRRKSCKVFVMLQKVNPVLLRE